ncbi:MAG: outer membrane protein assembly factor BamD [Bryobacteraceae bacterium]|nr:outer membrane protein assembly factor BamD [Bryobacteraceae bacterium]
MKRIAFFLLLPLLAAAQKRNDLAEVQRDVAMMTDEIRNIQKTVDRLNGTAEQTLANAAKNGAALANVQDALNQRIAAQEKNFAASLSATSAKVEQVSNDVGALRDTMTDVTARVNKLQTALADISAKLDILITKPEAPKPEAGYTTSATPPPGMTAEKLYENATKDKRAGQNDLAQQQFTDFLKWYGNTDLAPNAQFQIGSILFNTEKLDDALKAFDLVLTQYPENQKTPEAIYMKGMTYLKQGDKPKALVEFRAVSKRFPRSDAGRLATEQLAELGSKPTSALPPRKRAPR